MLFFLGFEPRSSTLYCSAFKFHTNHFEAKLVETKKITEI